MPNGTAGAGTAAAAGVGLRASSTIVAARCAKTKHCLVFMFPYGSPPEPPPALVLKNHRFHHQKVTSN
jgi:hypothetical protein